MPNEVLLSLLDLLEEMASGYKEQAQKMYAFEYALIEDKESAISSKLRTSYYGARGAVMSGENLGQEHEKWNERAARIESTISELRKKLSLTR